MIPAATGGGPGSADDIVSSTGGGAAGSAAAAAAATAATGGPLSRSSILRRLQSSDNNRHPTPLENRQHSLTALARVSTGRADPTVSPDEVGPGTATADPIIATRLGRMRNSLLRLHLRSSSSRDSLTSVGHTGASSVPRPESP
ncbi:hypothetical protein HK405_001663, partial [Cladochytrium tenue]